MLELLKLVELEHGPRNNRVRALKKLRRTTHQPGLISRDHRFASLILVLLISVTRVAAAAGASLGPSIVGIDHIPVAVDELTAYYIDRIAAGDGPAYLSFHARDTEKLVAALKSASIVFRQ